MAHATLIVTGGTDFDRDRDGDVRPPLALNCTQCHGPESASTFFPRTTTQRSLRRGIHRFPDEDALHAARIGRDGGGDGRRAPLHECIFVSERGHSVLTSRAPLGLTRLSTTRARPLPFFR